MTFGPAQVAGFNPADLIQAFTSGAGKDGPGPVFNFFFGDNDGAAAARPETAGTGETFAKDVRSARTSAEKRALIDEFVKAETRGGKPAGESSARETESTDRPRGAEVTRPDAPRASQGAAQELGFAPIMKHLGGLAQAVDESKLPEKTQGKLLDGIADLMSNLQDVQAEGGDVREAALKGVADLVQTLDESKGGEKAKGALMDQFADSLVGIARGKLPEAEAAAADDACGCDKGEETASASETEATSEPVSAEASDDCGSAAETASAEESAEQATSAEDAVWSHSVKDGKAEIQLGDAYTLTAEENGAAWTVKNNETGATTRIHGDPHVDVGADGQNDWDFKKDMTFQLDDGTKITVGTVDAGNGTTLSSSLTITNGDNAIQVTGLGAEKDGAGNLEIVQSNAGETLDDLARDGMTVREEGATWVARDGATVNQEIVNTAEAAA